MGELQVQEIEAIDDYDSSGIAWPWVAIAGACLLLVALLQIEGAALSCLILVASFLLSRYHPYSQETAALKASIVLSREDIEDTLRKYEDFLYKNDTESIADRTLHRPALADENCTDPDISSFHFLASTSRRFVPRLNDRLSRNLSIQQLESLLKPCLVELHSDSQYLVNAMGRGWIWGWAKKGWKGANKQPVKNPDLWKRMLRAIKPHRVEWVWVKGHVGTELNERCDELATRAADGLAGPLLVDAGFTE